MNKSLNKLKGSGVLIVVLSAITFTIYASSTYADAQHYNLIQKRYEENIIKHYEKDNQKIDDIYDEMVEIYKHS